MQLPRGDEYNQTIQNPRTAFKDVQLQNCDFEKNPIGLPKPYSGGFTTTYHLSNAKTNTNLAVRCFTRFIQDLDKRYAAITKFLKQNSNSHYFLKAEYQADGIRVNGKWFPIIKMEWTEGSPLNYYISKNIGNQKIIEHLLTDFKTLISELDRLNISHGDLQHGNIIVKNGKLVLIDYDGIYLDEIKNLKPNEIGHPNFQHPLRTPDYYDKRMDRFSQIIIWLGLRAINIKPELWSKYENGENILFKSMDFSDLENSPLIQELLKVQVLKTYVENFKKIRFLAFDKIPSLDDFIKGNIPKVSIPKILQPLPYNKGAYPIVDAFENNELMKYISQRVEVIGRTKKVYRGKDKYDEEFIFLFLGRKEQTFRLCFWPRKLESIKKYNLTQPDHYENQWISVTGVIYQGQKSLSLDIDNPSQIQVLTEDEAINRLNSKPTITNNINTTNSTTVQTKWWETWKS